MTAPEEKARQNIDRMLIEAGWVIQNMKDLNPGASLGVAVREYPTDSGEVDYALFVDRQPVGIIEAKKEGFLLSKTEEQSERYAKGELKYTIKQGAIPFVYESTGIETRFTDNRDPVPRAREVFSFFQPATLQDWLSQPATLRKRLQSIPKLSAEGLRKCQEQAILNLEKSFTSNRSRALIQMATGSGKTFAAITAGYRLLKFAKAKRILFLVDTKNLGEQAEQEFQAYTPNDDKRKFTELYGVQRLSSGFIDKSSQVCISTIQRMYSVLKGEELDESVELESQYEVRWQNENPQ